MARFIQGEFTPKNPDKYVGRRPIYSRSSWEWKVMTTFDQHPSVVSWASESIKIPYVNPFTGRATVYIPDFLVTYVDATGTQKTEIIEVKPQKETFIEAARGAKAQAAVALNSHKWAAARAFAQRHGIGFRVLNEGNIFNNPSRRR